MEYANVVPYAQVALNAYGASSLNTRDVEVLFAKIDGKMVIAFRGTEGEPCDLFSDLYALPWRPSELGGTWVHRGFWLATKVHLETIQSLVVSDKYVLVGHSLGAALATLTAAYMVKVGKKPQGLYLFASPHAGSRSLQETLNGIQAYHFFHTDDVVPTLPLALGATVWPHVGQQVPIGTGGHSMKNIVNSLANRKGGF